MLTNIISNQILGERLLRPKSLRLSDRKRRQAVELSPAVCDHTGKDSPTNTIIDIYYRETKRT